MRLSDEQAKALGLGGLIPKRTPRPASEMNETGSPPGRWVITIPGWHPTPLNRMIGVNRFVVQKHKRRDRTIVGVWSCTAGIPPVAGKRRVTLRITLAPRQRAADPDAYWKALLDAMVHLGLLKDDNRQWVELMPVSYNRGKAKETAIELEDIY